MPSRIERPIPSAWTYEPPGTGVGTSPLNCTYTSAATISAHVASCGSAPKKRTTGSRPWRRTSARVFLQQRTVTGEPQLERVAARIQRRGDLMRRA